ncbi:MAG: hypothetical protein C5B54_06760 [Acidobacteria bacterium]|nr:MAG: hypothetical protein C5B54_06760 [Acidobacteriota bacterium]
MNRRIAIVVCVATVMGAGNTFQVNEPLPQSLLYWYLWAGLFFVILRLTNRFSFTSGSRIKNLGIYVFAGVLIAAIHSLSITLFSEWVYHSGRDWHLFIANAFDAFFIYVTILALCLTFDFYQRVRAVKIQSVQAENQILRSQIESVKIQLDPTFVFKSLDEVAILIRKNLEEADSLIAEFGDYLRSHLENAGILEGTLRQQMERLNEQPDSNEQNIVVVLDEPNGAVDPELIQTKNANPIRKWIWIVGIYTFLACYFTVDRMFFVASNGRSPDWPQHYIHLGRWYIWALLTPVVLKLASRYPLQKPLLKPLLIHFAGMLMIWCTACIAYAGLKWAAGAGQIPFRNYVSFMPYFGLDAICYTTIAALENAVRYSRRFKWSQLRKARLNADLARSQLQVLKMQLHPHFLFNALNSLSQLMREDLDAAEDMIKNLKEFLQATLYDPDVHQIPFEKELQFLNRYLAIESIRFSDKLKVKMNIDPEAKKVLVPNLILQPIVENAIKHGIAFRRDPGEVEITAERRNGVLTVSVRDHGPGLGKTRQELISRPRVGISNTRERLFQMYGTRHRFELVNAPEGGLLVIMEIPTRMTQ